MAVASEASAQPTAPKAGMYIRMENPARRFKNGMKLQLLDSIAIFEVPRSKPKKVPRTLTLMKETEDSCTINWPEVTQDWHPARLQSAVCGEVEGMLEDGKHFWKLHKEYSPSEVAELVMQHKLPSPLPQLEDAIDASAAASASPDEEEAHCSREEMSLTSNPFEQPRVRPREWLDGHCA